jgi:oligopeptide/dipeptide ABC transporter ATP-binding protein
VTTAEQLVALEHIRVQFPVGQRTLTAVDDVSLHVNPGETLALVGESGSGKSTLGNVVAGLQRPTTGTIRFRGQPLDKSTRRSAQRAIQIIFQDPFGALDPRMPVSAIIAEPLLIQRVGDRRDRVARAADLVEQVGLPRDALNRYPHEFSGGQRQRIAIARALAPGPALIVADEPLSALDVSIQSQILNLLGNLQREHGLAYLFISHDLAVVNHLADRVAVLYLGRVVEVAPRPELFSTPSHPYTIALLEAMPRIGRRHRRAVAIHGEMPSALDPPSGCVFHTRCPRARDICSVEVPRLELAPGRPAQLAACHFKA